jgi:hypothetical protein
VSSASIFTFPNLFEPSPVSVSIFVSYPQIVPIIILAEELLSYSCRTIVE